MVSITFWFGLLSQRAVRGCWQGVLAEPQLEVYLLFCLRMLQLAHQPAQ